MAVVSLKVFLKASKSPKSAAICLAMAPIAWPPMPAVFAGHQLPESGVVGVAAAVVAHHAANVLGDGVEVGDEFVDRFGRQRRMAGQSGVHVVDVGLVMLVVVELHRLCIDERFESSVVVGQR